MTFKSEIHKEVFEREIVLCQKLSKENEGKCNWGVCKNCGVLPLLVKLNKGEVIEEEDILNKTRNNILSLKK